MVSSEVVPSRPRVEKDQLDQDVVELDAGSSNIEVEYEEVDVASGSEDEAEVSKAEVGGDMVVVSVAEYVGSVTDDVLVLFAIQSSHWL